MPGIGTWKVWSNLDPRWNKEGRAFGSGLTGPVELWKHIEECKEKYGDPPDDATMSFWKD